MAQTLHIAAALDRGEIPDDNAANSDCPKCKGHGKRRVVITPTDQLSPAARKLLKSVRHRRDGSIEVVLHDQLQAADMLNRMQGAYVERTESKSLVVNATLSTDQEIDPAALLSLWKESRS